MDIRPEWTPEFLEACEKMDVLFNWYEGAAIKEVNQQLLHARLDDLGEALEKGYIRFVLSGDDKTCLGPYQIRTDFILVGEEDMLDWEDYLYKLITLKRMGACDED